MSDKQPWCQHCKTIKNLQINSKAKRKDGSIRIAYICRGCNTERYRRYRATPKGAENTRKAVYRSIAKHSAKQKARLKLNDRVRRGVISASIRCEKCKELTKTEAHHNDYTEPLEVLWLCRPCHADLHNALRSAV